MKHASRLLVSSLAILLIGTGCQSRPVSDNAAASESRQVAEQFYDKPGFLVTAEDSRLWILKPGEKKSEKHVTMIGAGPKGMTLKALSNDTALEYLAARPGFEVEVSEGRLWVLKPGQKKSEKHATLIGAGPRGMTLKALDRDVALEYLASKPGYQIEVEEGCLWVLKPGEKRSEKHVTRIGVGPLNTTMRALDMDTLEGYLAYQPLINPPPGCCP